MRGLVCATLVVCATPAFAGAGGIAVLTSGGDARRDAVLVDALRIYTRDLGRTVRAGGAAPPTLHPDAIARVASDARRDGDDVVVWFTEHHGEPVLVALVAATGDLRETTVEREEPLGLVAQQFMAPPHPRRLTPETLAWARDRPDAADASFTPEEEAFFASGIDHLLVDHYEN